MTRPEPRGARLAGLAPVVAPDTRLLILGSLPGSASLAAARYYAHPRNQFWVLVGGLVGEPLEKLCHAERLAALARHRIGLWDVVASARRDGSLDADLRGVVPNRLADMAASLPALRAIAFNGKTAARWGRRLLMPSARIALVDLPSSSPAYTLALERKAAAWQALGDYLDRSAPGMPGQTACSGMVDDPEPDAPPFM